MIHVPCFCRPNDTKIAYVKPYHIALYMLSFWSLLSRCGTSLAEPRCMPSLSFKTSWQDPVLMPTSLATSRIVKRRFARITERTLSVDVKRRPSLKFSSINILPDWRRLKHSWQYAVQTFFLILLLKQTYVSVKVLHKLVAPLSLKYYLSIAMNGHATSSVQAQKRNDYRPR